MRSVHTTDTYYIDLRPVLQSEQISLDLSRHLLCRMTAGKVVVIAAQPRIFCSVLRRRWKRIVQETELQWCLTLNRTKKQQLAEQLERLRSLVFSSKASVACDVLVISPQQADSSLSSCATLYVATSLGGYTPKHLSHSLRGGLAVVYQPFWQDFIKALHTVTPHRKPSALK